MPNTYTTDSFGENVLPKAEGEAVSQRKGAPTEADAPYCSNPLTAGVEGTGGSWYFQRAWQARCCEVCSEHAALV